MPLVFFVSPTDPSMLHTIEATMRPPAGGGLMSNSLVYRYHSKTKIDGLEGDEGTFNMCTFWLVEAMTRAGRTDRRLLEQARLIFESMLGYANHVGLYGEETGPSGETLGNFPQALTHLALISAAFNLNRRSARTNMIGRDYRVPVCAMAPVRKAKVKRKIMIQISSAKKLLLVLKNH